uniref:CST complex subunit STN1-like isoform X1 n=1 Tax=Myxine glutinosa TaxID=7769 RepID=UPI00358DF488
MDGDEVKVCDWGLDSIHRCHVRLFIADVLRLVPSVTVSGVYFYNNRAVTHVELLGTIVKVKENEKSFCVSVDDGTGVISCTCWKQTRSFLQSDDPALNSPALEVLWGAASRGRSWDTGEYSKEVVVALPTLGLQARIRGRIQEFRNQREIFATNYAFLVDPLLSLQICHMLELPCLYRDVYDQSFNPSPKHQN